MAAGVAGVRACEVPPWRGWGRGGPGSCGRVLLALRSASGLGPPAGAGGPAPAAFNRAGEKAPGAGGQLPRVAGEVVLDDMGGLAVPFSSGSGFRAPWAVRVSAGQAASGVRAAPEAAAASQVASWTVMK